jgi:hypothetical protein
MYKPCLVLCIDRGGGRRRAHRRVRGCGLDTPASVDHAVDERQAIRQGEEGNAIHLPHGKITICTPHHGHPNIDI